MVFGKQNLEPISTTNLLLLVSVMKSVHIFLSSLFFLTIQSLNYNEVEARRGDVIPMGLYGSSEKHLKGSQMNGHARESYEYEKAELPEFRKRKTKKKHNVIKKKKSHIKKSEAQDKQKFRRKGKKRDSKRFIKTTLKNIDKDSNLSDSEDNDKMTKPVDIIVHIKMKD